jgi:ribosome-binding protein aMBF1 (putative translation factor)
MNRYEPATCFIPQIVNFLGYCPYRTPGSFGAWMKQGRTTMGLSQEALARAITMDESTMADWERGEHMPIQKNVEKVKAFFRLNGQS